MSHYVFTFAVDSDVPPAELGRQIGVGLNGVEADVELISCEADGVYVYLNEEGDVAYQAT